MRTNSAHNIRKLVIAASFAGAIVLQTNIAPARAQSGSAAPSQVDTAAVWHAAGDYLRTTVGPRLMITRGLRLCTPGTNLCADSEAITAHLHATAAATGLPEVTGPVKQTCRNHICRFDDVNGIVIFGVPSFTGATATVTVSMMMHPDRAPANWYEEDELQLTRSANGWVVTGRKLLEIT